MNRRKVILILFLPAAVLMNACGSSSSTPVIPKGTIIAWYDKTSLVPDGWAVCDGNNGTPDLRDNFILGAQYQNENGISIGSNTHSHTVSVTGSYKDSLKVQCRMEGSGITQDAKSDTDPKAAITTGDLSTVATGAEHKHAFDVSLLGETTIPLNIKDLQSAGNTGSVTQYPKSVKILFIMKIK